MFVGKRVPLSIEVLFSKRVALGPKKKNNGFPMTLSTQFLSNPGFFNIILIPRKKYKKKNPNRPTLQILGQLVETHHLFFWPRGTVLQEKKG